jgi:rSAM/selenodomain-associated transferase 2
MISIVIPTLAEARALPATLEAVLAQQRPWEILVVDGGSADATRRIAEGFAARRPEIRCRVAARGRALQLNAGAAEARGEWLLFLHADTLLPPTALARIAALPVAIQAGCFRQRFSSASRLLRLLSWLHNRRFTATRVIYGDQAMFVRRRLFEELGGFPDRPMEDVAFSLGLRKVTKPVMLDDFVTTDARKFDQMGHWRALGRAVGLLVRFRLGLELADDEFFQAYR